MINDNRHSRDNWRTTSFAPLPAGWINVYENVDGTYRTEACPGVLIQKCTGTTWYWDEEHDGRIVTRERTGKEDRGIIRAVFAAPHCAGYAALRAADAGGSTYLRTVPAEEFALWPAP